MSSDRLTQRILDESAQAMRDKLTREQWRILIAVDEGRMHTNSNGRYVIDYEERPDRKSRERLRGRGLIESRYEYGGRGSYWAITEKGRKWLLDAGFGYESRQAS